MSAQDDRDLSAPFEELSAPPSTASYATRTPSLDIRTARVRWPQALATALVVLVAVAGAGTFLALRSARQGGGPSGTAGTPPARWDAAMAYDSSAGVTVMFGGTNASGKPLTDTWTWNGAAWKAAASGPTSMVDVRMVDDPADGGVLMLGTAAPANSATGAGGATGCAVGSAGSAGAGTSTAIPPLAATAAPGRTPVRPTGPPLGDPLPSAAAISPSSTCQAIAPIPQAASEQTWLFHDGGWSRLASGSSAMAPPGGTELAFDATTHQVVAASTNGFTCGGPPLAAPTSAAIACPLIGSNSSNASTPVHCGVVPATCVGTGSISTWTWSRGAWGMVSVQSTATPAGLNFLFEDPATEHATLMTQSGLAGYAEPAISCPAMGKCAAPVPIRPQAPLVTTWTWTGTTWRLVSQLLNQQATPDLAGANLTTIGSHVVVLTAAGDTWTWAAGQWTLDSPASRPAARGGAAMSEGPGGTIVLFGGTFGLGVTALPGGVGSDTWTWDGSSWKQRGGNQPSAPPVASCPALANGSIPPCVQPEPARVAPASAAVTAPAVTP